MSRTITYRKLLPNAWVSSDTWLTDSYFWNGRAKILSLSLVAAPNTMENVYRTGISFDYVDDKMDFYFFGKQIARPRPNNEIFIHSADHKLYFIDSLLEHVHFKCVQVRINSNYNVIPYGP